jgi:hypothetical protein
MTMSKTPMAIAALGPGARLFGEEELGTEGEGLGTEEIEEFWRLVGYIGTTEFGASLSHLHRETEKFPRS